MQEIRRLLEIFRPLRWSMFLLFIASTSVAIVGSTIPWIYREVINFLTTGNISDLFANFIPYPAPQLTTLIYLLGIYFVVLFVDDILSLVRRYLNPTLHARAWAILRVESIRKLQTLSMPFFYKTPPGALVEQIGPGTRESFPIIEIILVEIWPIFIRLVLAITAIAVINSLMGVMLGVLMVLYAVVSLYKSRVNASYEEKIKPYFEASGKVLMQSITYQELIKQFTREEDFEAEAFAITRIVLEKRRQQAIYRVTYAFIQELLWKIAEVLALGYGGYLVVVEKSLSVGDLVLFMAFIERAMGPLSGLMNSYDQIQSNLVSVRRMLKVWDTPSEVEDKPDAKNLKIKKGEVEFRNVTFEYSSPSGKKPVTVFKNFSIKIQPGETIALVGPSGAGKSTLIKLLARFYDPTQGEILIDGQNITDVTQKSLRRSISAIMQDSIVLNDSIKNNLKFAKKSASNLELEKTLKLASLYDFVKGLADKMNTVLGERGVHLSGGERQRMGIARAMLKNAPIVVMDEATSALDSVNESKIQAAMWRLIKNKTTIIIAHRLSTVKKADRILVLDKGRIVEEGTHNQLIAKGGHYKKLYKLQSIIRK